jgi:hypothetical protein
MSNHTKLDQSIALIHSQRGTAVVTLLVCFMLRHSLLLCVNPTMQGSITWCQTIAIVFFVFIQLVAPFLPSETRTPRNHHPIKSNVVQLFHSVFQQFVLLVSGPLGSHPCCQRMWSLVLFGLAWHQAMAILFAKIFKFVKH